MAPPDESTLRPARAQTARRLLLAAASLAAAIALAEGVLRVAWDNPYRTESPDRVLVLRIPHAGRALSVDRSAIWPGEAPVQLRTDERGYILPSRRFEDPDATIVFLGGSTTECAVLPEEQRFPALVSSLLEARGLRVNTLNAALSGNTAHDALNVLVNHVSQDRPDVVVLMEATNDAGVLAQDGSYRSRSGEPASAGVAARWLLQNASSRLALFGLLRSATTLRPPEARGAAQADERAAAPVEPYVARLRAFVRVGRALGIEPVLMTQPLAGYTNELTPAWARAADQVAFNDAVRGVAEADGAILIDLARYVADQVSEPDLREVFYDGMHVTERGSRIYAEYVAARLQVTVLRREASDTLRAPGGSR